MFFNGIHIGPNGLESVADRLAGDRGQRCCRGAERSGKINVSELLFTALTYVCRMSMNLDQKLGASPGDR